MPRVAREPPGSRAPRGGSTRPAARKILLGASGGELRAGAPGCAKPRFTDRMTAAVFFFLFSIGFLVYVLAIYPVLLYLWAQALPRPIRKAPIRTRVSIVVPVRNGAPWVEAKIRSLLETNYPGDLIEILIASDGSTDGSEEIVRSYPDPRVHLLALPPGGKAVAVNRGIESVSGEIVVLTDVRQTFDPDAIPRLLACFAEPAVGVVTGELVIREGASHEEYNTGLYWRYEKWIRRNLNR